ncbi:MAG: alcohol dehydrogenase catalytic domain-containing protein [Fimbriimonadales bacterium]|nr:alcohol dehydrogenase catalytic domain-containing protein [Fimbriimonadales bacterium]
MRKLVLTGIRTMEVVPAADPVPGPGEVLLRVESVGVCGSDVHYWRHGRIGDQVVEYPFSVGHEMAGTVVGLGEGVEGLSVGQLVAVEPAISCRECDQCRQGRSHTCRRLRFLGCPGQVEGCLSDLIAMPAQCCFPVPQGFDPDLAMLIEPLSIGLYAVRRVGPLRGRRVAVLGSGPIGCSALLMAKAEGAFVWASDKVPERIRMALRLGADAAGTPVELDEQPPFDVAIECCGEQEALDQAVRILGPGGKLAVVGIPAEDRVSFAAHEVRRKEIDIFAIRRQNECVAPALRMVVEGAVDPTPMVTHRFPLERAQEAFELASEYRDGVLKAAIRL